MKPRESHVDARVPRRTDRLKSALLASFHRPADEIATRLAEFSETDWRAVLLWLDLGGIALYVLDQLTKLQLENAIPESIRLRLSRNLDENRQRTRAHIGETTTLAKRFEHTRIPCVFLKGLTLMPDAVPDCSLRWQSDLDLLIAADDREPAMSILMEMGYTVHAAAGNIVELRAGVLDLPGFSKLYRAQSLRALELHLASDASGAYLLKRSQERVIESISLRALSSPDILVQQAVHLLKHLCTEHTRLSWVLEFWRHVRARRQDGTFWDAVRAIAASETNGAISLGAAFWLSTELFGAIGRNDMERWAREQLPESVERWLQLYGRKLLLSDSMGTKLYLILRRQLSGVRIQNNSASWRRLIPLYLPLRITKAAPNESLPARLKRYYIELRHFWLRLKFHFVEGLRFVWESTHWKRNLRNVECR